MPEFQKKMDAASGDEQLALKKNLLNSLERYFYLVCFGAYCRLEGRHESLEIIIEKSRDRHLREINSYSGVNNFEKTFVSWLSERSYIAEMVENGIRVWEEMTFFSLNMTLPA